jgi:phospholipid/cholesterol/gamma-HCH transport system substrate-binding protein
MKKDSINKIKLGIFVSLGIVIFITGIYFIGQTKKMFSSTFRVSALFKDVNGLQVGNNVRFAGINVGSVDFIEIITDTSVKVDMIVDVKTQKFIKKDSKAIIGTDGLMGNKIMNISPGTTGKAEIENNDMIGTTIPISIDDMLSKLKTTGDNAAKITTDLAAIIDNISSGKGTIGKLFMDTAFAGNIDRTLVNVKEGTKGFKQTMDAAQDSWLIGGIFGGNSKEKAADKLKEKKEEQLKEKKKIAEEKKKKKEEQLIEKKKKAEELKKKKEEQLKAKKKLAEEKKK